MCLVANGVFIDITEDIFCFVNNIVFSLLSFMIHLLCNFYQLLRIQVVVKSLMLRMICPGITQREFSRQRTFN